MEWQAGFWYDYKPRSIYYKLSLFKYYIWKSTILGSSESLTCEDCGAIFSTIEALNEHLNTEREQKIA